MRVLRGAVAASPQHAATPPSAHRSTSESDEAEAMPLRAPRAAALTRVRYALSGACAATRSLDTHTRRARCRSRQWTCSGLQDSKVLHSERGAAAPHAPRQEGTRAWLALPPCQRQLLLLVARVWRRRQVGQVAVAPRAAAEEDGGGAVRERLCVALRRGRRRAHTADAATAAAVPAAAPHAPHGEGRKV